jgi:hypothetical protein
MSFPAQTDLPPHPGPLRILSLGAGVQSTTMALMAAHGLIGPMPDAAIFADTGAEPQAVYDHLRWMMSPNVLPFPVHIVSAGNIIEGIEAMVAGRRWVSIPAFVADKTGRGGPIPRQCTKEYKIVPIHRKLREMVGVAPRQSMRSHLKLKRKEPLPVLVEQWIGISADEAHRMKPSGHDWVENRWPLLELRMRRSDCLTWLERNAYPAPPKSSCTFCPFHDTAMWRDLKDNHPAAWEQALAVDALIAPGAPATETRSGTKPMYLHRSLKRLADVDLSTPEENGQGWMFGEECEGVCGV